eukprot:1099193-Rhodomonas_salina.1
MALQQDEGDVMSRFNLANALTEGLMYKASIEQFSRVLEARPDHIEARCNMARNMEAICDWTD